MNILFLSQVLPFPLDAGPKVRSYYVLRYLGQTHRVTLVAFTRATDSPPAIAHLESICHAVHSVPLFRSRVQDGKHLLLSLAQARPFLIVRDDLRVMDEHVRALTHQNRFDVVHADQLSMAHYALRVPRVRRILDQHNAVWTIAQRLAENETLRAKKFLLAREARLLRAYEAATCAQFDRVVTVTDQDKRALTFSQHDRLTRVSPPPLRAPIATIPICIDPQDIAPLPFHPNARDVVCVGGMFYPPNVDGMVWFAREVMPHVWQKSPETKFFVVGARPARALVALGEREPRIVVTGYVADTNEYLARAATFVVPLRAGGGMRVKILDAWARGLPMVSTTIGAEGITYIKDENILIADEPRAFAAAVLKLIHNRTFAKRIAEKGRVWVEEKYAWRTIYRAWDEVYLDAS